MNKSKNIKNKKREEVNQNEKISYGELRNSGGIYHCDLDYRFLLRLCFVKTCYGISTKKKHVCRSRDNRGGMKKCGYSNKYLRG